MKLFLQNNLFNDENGAWFMFNEKNVFVGTYRI